MIKAGINRVMVLPDEPKDKYIGSIIVPDNKKKVSNEGTIISIGKLESPYSDYPEQLKEGDKVMWNPNWEKMEGYEIMIDGKRHYIFHIELVLGKLCTPQNQ